MLQDKLNSIRDSILRYNTYFKNGYSSVYVDDKSVRETKKQIAVFPNDTLGDYFYIRLADAAAFKFTPRVLADCINGYDLTANLVLVAVVNNADSGDLIHNLVSTFSQIGGTNVTSAIWIKEDVVKEEMKSMDKKEINAALSKLKADHTIVSVKFGYNGTIGIIDLNCIQNPCTTCS